MKLISAPLLPLTGILALAACAPTYKPPRISYDNPPQRAVLLPDPPKPVDIIQVPTPLPLPGQLQPAPADRISPAELPNPAARVAAANAAARMQPTRDDYFNAIQVYPFTDGALYEVYAAPEDITDIALQPGEQLVGPGPVAAGDTVRWIIGDTTSGTGANTQVHILVKPTRPDLTTNLIINTDRRTYHLELRSTAATYMASISWNYPEDQLIAIRQQNTQADQAAPIATGVDVSALNFRYKIEGDNPPWRPLRAFDDGRQVFIEFPSGIGQGDMPPLFVIGPSGKTTDLVNYRVRGADMIVDTLFAEGELQMGDGSSQQRVRIVRTDGIPAQ
jgi:P-type conjugative transfer protein TrbG